MTFADWKSAVVAAYNDSAQLTDREAAAYMAVADFVRAEVVKTVEADLQLSKSFRDSYLTKKLALAGYTITGNFATVRAAVGTYISVYNDMVAISTLVDSLTQRGIDDFNGTATLFDSALVECAIDLQRTIDYYRSRHLTYYKPEDFDTNGSASIAQMPEGARPYRWVYQTYYPLLAEGVAYADDAYVASNGRVYKVTVGGTLGVGELGAGLTSTDPDATETLGSLSFVYQSDPVCYNRIMTATSWKTRETLSCDHCDCSPTDTQVADYTADQLLALRASNYLYALEPRGRSFWVWPKVRDYWQVQVEWDGIQIEFDDADEVLFGPKEARAAAFYIRSILQRLITESVQAANMAMQLYALERKQLWQQRDEQKRELL